MVLTTEHTEWYRPPLIVVNVAFGSPLPCPRPEKGAKQQTIRYGTGSETEGLGSDNDAASGGATK